MSNGMVDYLRTRRVCCVAELAQIDRLLAATGYPADGDNGPGTIDLGRFNPAWKRDDATGYQNLVVGLFSRLTISACDKGMSASCFMSHRALPITGTDAGSFHGG